MTQSRIIKSACGLCLHQCGIDIHVEADRIVKVTGTKEHPSNKGVLCPNGSDYMTGETLFVDGGFSTTIRFKQM